MHITINSDDYDDTKFMKQLISYYIEDDIQPEINQTEEYIQEVKFPDECNIERLISENKLIIVGGGNNDGIELNPQYEFINQIIQKAEPFKITVIDNKITFEHSSNWNQPCINTLIFSEQSGFEYLDKLNTESFERELVIITDICNMWLSYKELLSAVLHRLSNSKNISVICLSNNLEFNSVLDDIDIPCRCLFHTDSIDYSERMVGNDSATFLQNNNFILYNQETNTSFLGLFDIPETLDI